MGYEDLVLIKEVEQPLRPQPQPHNGNDNDNDNNKGQPPAKRSCLSTDNSKLPHISSESDGNSVELREFIGNGAFSEVWRGVWTARGGAKVDVAAKVLRRVEDGSDPDFDARYQHEVASLRLVASCPNVVRFVGTISVPSVICTEYVEGKTLHKWLKDYRHEAARYHVAVRVASALSSIHSLGIAHRDVNSSNIIIRASRSDDDDDDDSDDDEDVTELPEPYLCDFGLACHVNELPEEGEEMRRVCHPRWRPPEVTQGLVKVGQWDRCDVWCYGLLLWELVTCTLPYEGLDDKGACAEAVQGKRPPVESLEDTLGHSGIPSLIVRCLNMNPTLRPTSAEIVRVLTDKKLTKKNVTTTAAAAATTNKPQIESK